MPVQSFCSRTHGQSFSVFLYNTYVCPRSLVHFYMVIRYIEMYKTSWTYSISRFEFTTIILITLDNKKDKLFNNLPWRSIYKKSLGFKYNGFQRLKLEWPSFEVLISGCAVLYDKWIDKKESIDMETFLYYLPL